MQFFLKFLPVLYLRHRLNRYGLEELESLKAIPDRFPFVSAKMDEKKDNNWFTRLDYSGIFFFELASKARSSELVYCVFYMDKPLLLWAGRPSVSMNGLTMSLQCLVESIASLFTHRRLFSSHRSRDTRPSFNYELSSLESWKKGVVKWKKKGIPYWIVPSQSNTKTSNEPLYVVGSRD